MGGLAGLLATLAIGIYLFVDFDSHRAAIERTASQALGWEVRLAGRMSVGFIPDFHVTLRDVRARNGERDIARIGVTKIGLALLPLLRDEIRLRRISLDRAHIYIEHDRNGRLNIDTGSTTPAPRPAVTLDLLTVTRATVTYTDAATGEYYRADGCGATLNNLNLGAATDGSVMDRLSLSARADCNEWGNRRLKSTNLKLRLNGSNGRLVIDPLTLQVFGNKANGRIRLDFTRATPRIDIDYALPRIELASVFGTLSPPRKASGQMMLSVTLSMQGRSAMELRRSLNGSVVLHGQDLVVSGVNLDEALARYESSQNFDLVDLGAFFYAGPLGLAVTKGYDFAGVFQQGNGRTRVRRFMSSWQIERGVARATDVALATPMHRLAVRGTLDLVSRRFINLRVALLDARGCAKVEQRISGLFTDPTIDKPSMLASLAAPAVNLLKRARSLLPGADTRCTVVYRGSVAAPK